jgi:hypothetical protein
MPAEYGSGFTEFLISRLTWKSSGMDFEKSSLGSASLTAYQARTSIASSGQLGYFDLETRVLEPLETIKAPMELAQFCSSA